MKRAWSLLWAAKWISRWEGYTPYPFWDTIAYPPVLTAGYGHTGADVVVGQYWSKAKAVRVLARDCRSAAKAVNRSIRVPLTVRQRMALISGAFNNGPGFVEGSTLQRKLNARDYRGAADEILRWDKAGNPPSPVWGLTRRRRAERRMFLSQPERWRKWQKR